MPGQTQRYTIEADNSQSLAANRQVNDSLAALGTAAQRYADQVNRGVGAATSTVQAHGRAVALASSAWGAFHTTVVRSVEVLGGVALAAHSAVTAVAAIGPSAATAAAGIEKLTNLYRALRFAAEPTPFTVATIAGGVLLEKNLALASRTGTFVDQQSLVAARSNYSYQDAQRLATAAQISNQPSNYYQNIYSDVRSTASTPAGQKALGALGFTDIQLPNVKDLQDIGQALSDIEDPARRAQVALALFPHTASEALKTLPNDFTYANQAIDRFNVLLSRDSEESVSKFRQNIDSLKGGAKDVEEFFGSIGGSIRNTFARLGADVGNELFNILRSPLTGLEYLDFATRGRELPSTLLAQRQLPGIVNGINADLNTASNNSLRNAQARTAAGDVDGILARENATKDGLAAQLSDAKSKLSEAQSAYVKARSHGVPDLDLSNAVISATRSVKALEDAQPDTEALRGASELSKRISELTLHEGTGVYRAIQTARAYIDKDGNSGLRSLSDQDRLSAERAYHDEVRKLQREDSAKAVELYDQEFQTRLGQDSQLFEKRQQLSAQAYQSLRGTYESQLGAEGDFVTANRDSALIGLRIRGATGMDEINSTLGINSNYLGQSSALDIERIQRQQSQQLIDAGLLVYDPSTGGLVNKEDLVSQKFAYVPNPNYDPKLANRLNPNFDPNAPFGDPRGSKYLPDLPNSSPLLPTFVNQTTPLTADETATRNAIIAKSGADADAVSRKYDLGITDAQQQAALATGDLIRQEQERDFDSIKAKTGEVFDALTTQGKNAFHALGDVLRSTFLGAIRDIVSNQIAKSLFNALNPNAPVSFKDDDLGVHGFADMFGAGSLGIGAKPRFGTLPIQFGQPGGPAGTVSSTSRFQIPAIPQYLGIPGVTSNIPSDQNYSTFPGAAVDGSGVAWDGSTADVAAGVPGSQGGGATPGFGGAVGVAGSFGPALMGMIPISADPALAQVSTVVGGPGGTSGFAGPVSGATWSMAGVGVGGLSGIGGGGTGMVHGQGAGGFNIGSLLKGGKDGMNPKSLLSTVYNSAAGSAASDALGGGLFGSLAGGVAGFAASPAGGALGTTMLLGGLSAKHQTLGTAASATAGGALAGANLGNQYPEVGEGNGAIIGAGVGLYGAGVRRGGGVGFAEDVAGGATAGFGIGNAVAGPVGGLIGAGIGAVVGAVTGVVGLIFPPADTQIIDEIKKKYGITVDWRVAEQVGKIAKASYGGSYSLAITSPQVMSLLSLYAQNTGQKFMLRSTPLGVNLTDTTGGLKQAPVYVDGSGISYASQAGIGVLNNQATTVLSNYTMSQTTSKFGGQYVTNAAGNPQMISIQLDGNSSAQFLQGQTVAAIGNYPTVSADAVASAQSMSYDRNTAAARLISPNTLFM